MVDGIVRDWSEVCVIPCIGRCARCSGARTHQQRLWTALHAAQHLALDLLCVLAEHEEAQSS